MKKKSDVKRKMNELAKEYKSKKRRLQKEQNEKKRQEAIRKANRR